MPKSSILRGAAFHEPAHKQLQCHRQCHLPIDAGVGRADFNKDEFGRYAGQFTMFNPPKNIFGAIPYETQVLHGNAAKVRFRTSEAHAFVPHRMAAPIMDDGISDENNLRPVRAIELNYWAWRVCQS